MFISILLRIAPRKSYLESSSLEAIESSYKTALQEVRGTTVVSVGHPPSKITSGISGNSAQRLFEVATVTRLIFENKGGVHILRLPTKNEASNGPIKMFGLINSLHSDQRKNLFGAGLLVSSLPANLQNKMLSALDMVGRQATYLRSNPDAFLKFSVGYQATELSGPKPGSQVLGNTGYSHTVGPMPLKEVLANCAKIILPKETSATFKSDFGPLNFGAGRLIRIATILDMAGNKYKKGYLLDERLRQDYVFVKGSFSENGFETAIRELTRVLPFQTNPLSPEMALRQLLDGKLRTYVKSEKPKMSFSPSFLQKNVVIPYSFLQRTSDFGYPPHGNSFKLAPALFVNIFFGNPGGVTTSGNYLTEVFK